MDTQDAVNRVWWGGWGGDKLTVLIFVKESTCSTCIILSSA